MNSAMILTGTVHVLCGAFHGWFRLVLILNQYVEDHPHPQ